MGFVLVISLPFIFFAILLGFGCYYFGKAKDVHHGTVHQCDHGDDGAEAQ